MKREIERVYKALADWNRLRILKMLEVRSLCGCEISHVLKIVHSAISRHLKILKEADLIIDRREGSFILYSLNTGTSSPAAASQLGLLRGWLNDEHQVQSDRKILAKVDRFQLTSQCSRV